MPEPKLYFWDMVMNYINKVYPWYDTFCLKKSIENNIWEFDEVFRDLRKIHKYKERYDLHRAMKNANKEFERLLSKMFKTQVAPRAEHLHKQLTKISEESNQSMIFDTKLFEKIAKKRQQTFTLKRRYFRLLSIAVDFIDIILSAFVVMLVTMIFHVEEWTFWSIYMSLLFLFLIAVLKVTLDRFWIQPIVDRLWRKMYINSIKRLKSTLAKYEAVSIIMTDSIMNQDPPTKTVELLHRWVMFVKK